MSDTAIALGFSYRGVVDEGQKELVFQSHVPVDASAEEINAVLDKVRIAVDRQKAFYDLQRAKANFDRELLKTEEIEKQMVLQQQAYMASWEASGRKGEWNEERIPAKEKQVKISLLQSLTASRGLLQRHDDEIKRLSRLVNGHAPDFGTDSNAGLSEG